MGKFISICRGRLSPPETGFWSSSYYCCCCCCIVDCPLVTIYQSISLPRHQMTPIPEEKRKTRRKGLIFFGQCVTTETGVLLIMQEFRQLRAINSQWWRRPSFPSSLIDKVCVSIEFNLNNAYKSR